ncbi:MAG: hypothetical protein ACXADB_06020 [Candidatus Hermodarchaeia archaeon]|jgi:hypothetical protein
MSDEKLQFSIRSMLVFTFVYALIVCLPLGIWAEHKRQEAERIKEWHEMWGTDPHRVHFRTPRSNGFITMREPAPLSIMKREVQACIAAPGKLCTGHEITEETIILGRYVPLTDITIWKVEVVKRKGAYNDSMVELVWRRR